MTTRTVQGLWGNVSDRYLGVRFNIQGKKHFGWARLTVHDQGHNIGWRLERRDCRSGSANVCGRCNRTQLIFANPLFGVTFLFHPGIRGSRTLATVIQSWQEGPKMYHVRQRNLPFVGSSHEFIGAEHGNTSVSVFLFHGNPGSGPGPHRHPYDEIQFIREGRGVWTVSGETFEASAGDIFVMKAGEIHSFKAIGESPLVQFDVHLSPRFIQENL